MKRRITTLALIAFLISITLLSSCKTTETPSDSNEVFEVKFFRKVARETLDNGWVYTFVYEDLKDESADNSTGIKYSFYGINIRYRYADKFEGDPNASDMSDSQNCLLLGYGSDAEARDMELISSMIYKDKTVEELLSLDPNDYEFEVVDKDIFFELMRKALTSEPQKEGTDLTYWEKPVYAFMAEPAYLSGYKFQICFLHETGCVDELYIDVLYQTGNGAKDYVQLSDLVDNGTATEEQKQAFDLICSIVNDIKENENYIVNSENYENKKIGDIDFNRLYTFLENIHNNNFESYN